VDDVVSYARASTGQKATDFFEEAFDLDAPSESPEGVRIETVEIDGQWYLRIYLPPDIEAGSLLAADIEACAERFIRAWGIVMKSGGTGVIKIGIRDGRIRWVTPVVTKGLDTSTS
jgi:hypothetical protein